MSISNWDEFPFPLADPVPPAAEIISPCGCVYMELQPGENPVQVAWCDTHDPGYEEGDSIG